MEFTFAHTTTGFAVSTTDHTYRIEFGTLHERPAAALFEDGEFEGIIEPFNPSELGRKAWEFVRISARYSAR